jgi:hypothetical protein
MLEIFKKVTHKDNLALGPILLVCSKWYNLAVNSPSLWAAICLNFQDTPSTAEFRRRTQYVKSAIRNSKEAPLDIDLAFPCHIHLANTMLENLLDPDDSNNRPYGERSEGLRNWVREAIDYDPEGLPMYRDVSQGLSQFMVTLAGSSG